MCVCNSGYKLDDQIKKKKLSKLLSSQQQNYVNPTFIGPDRCHITGIPDYQMVPIMTQVLTGKFCYCSYTWAVLLIREYSIWIPPSSAASGTSVSSSVFSGVLRCKDVDEV